MRPTGIQHLRFTPHSLNTLIDDNGVQYVFEESKCPAGRQSWVHEVKIIPPGATKPLAQLYLAKQAQVASEDTIESYKQEVHLGRSIGEDYQLLEIADKAGNPISLCILMPAYSGCDLETLNSMRSQHATQGDLETVAMIDAWKPREGFNKNALMHRLNNLLAMTQQLSKQINTLITVSNEPYVFDLKIENTIVCPKTFEAHIIDFVNDNYTLKNLPQKLLAELQGYFHDETATKDYLYSQKAWWLPILAQQFAYILLDLSWPFVILTEETPLYDGITGSTFTTHDATINHVPEIRPIIDRYLDVIDHLLTIAGIPIQPADHAISLQEIWLSHLKPFINETDLHDPAEEFNLKKALCALMTGFSNQILLLQKELEKVIAATQSRDEHTSAAAAAVTQGTFRAGAGAGAGASPSSDPDGTLVSMRAS